MPRLHSALQVRDSSPLIEDCELALLPRAFLFKAESLKTIKGGGLGFSEAKHNWLVVTGTSMLFFHILGIVIPTKYCSDGLKPLTTLVDKTATGVLAGGKKRCWIKW